MRNVALAVLILASATACRRNDSAAAKKDPDEKKGPSPAALVFRKKPPVVGMKVRETIETAFNVELVAGGSKSSVASSSSNTRLEEVLAVDGFQVTKVRVTYEARAETNTMSLGATGPKSSPVVGKTYVVERDGAALAVRDDAGKKPPADELTILESDYHSMIEGDPLPDGLPDTTLRPGEPVPKLATALKRRMTPKGATGFESEVEVKFDGPTRLGTEVVFNVKATYSLGSGAGVVTLPLSGTFTLRLDGGWLSEFAMSGPVEMGDAGPAFIADGKMKVSGKRTYL